MRPRALIYVVLATLVLAAPAGAATVKHTARTEAGNKSADFVVTTVAVEAAPAEANAITATVAAAGAKLVLSDPAAPLTAAAGCTQVGAGAVECPLPDEMSAQLGDGNDVFAMDAALRTRTSLFGGPGDDTLTGGAGMDSLSGGGGRDVLVGGLGEDLLADDDGGAPDADVLDGGAGPGDSVDFEDHTAGMTLDLPAKRSSEGDAVSGVETIRLGGGADIVRGTAAGEFITAGEGANVVDGGAGNDTINGSGRISGADGNDSLGCGGLEGCVMSGGAGRDSLQSGDGDDVLDGGGGDDDLTGLRGDDVIDGGPGKDRLLGDLAEGVPGAGDDTLRGGPGADRLYGGPGSDNLDGGTGADVVLSLDQARDRIDCGTGRDLLRRDRRDPLRPASCERVRLGGTLILLPDDATVGLFGSEGELVVGTSCPVYVVGPCRGVAEMRSLAGRLLGRARYRRALNGSIVIPLNGAGLAAVRRGSRRFVVRVRGGDATGGISVVARSYRVTVS